MARAIDHPDYLVRNAAYMLADLRDEVEKLHALGNRLIDLVQGHTRRNEQHEAAAIRLAEHLFATIAFKIDDLETALERLNG